MKQQRMNEKKRFLASTRLVPYEKVYRQIRNADLLLFRKTGVISIAGRGIHSHAAKAAWWGNDLFCLEIREFHGGRAVTLESQAKRYPGRIDVFRANADNRWPEYNRLLATAAMRRFAGCDYGYWNVFKTALTHVPFLRFLCRPTFADQEDEGWRDYLFGGEKIPTGYNEMIDPLQSPYDWSGNESPYPPELSREFPLETTDLFDLPNERTTKSKMRGFTEKGPDHPTPQKRFQKISPPYCSEACSIADRIGGGVNPVELLSDRFTEPADLARSPFYHYLFTLK